MVRPCFRRPLALILVLLLLTAAGCRHAAPKTPDSRLQFIAGPATVLRFDKDMKYAVLDTTHGQKPAWWDTTTEISRDHTAAAEPSGGFLGAAHAGNFNHGTVGSTDWEARPGDQIQITGFESNGEIFLRKVRLK